MKTFSFLTATVTWFAFVTVAQAQMSTIPAPPSLGPPAEQASNDAAKNTGGAVTDAAESIGTGDKAPDSGKASMPNTASSSQPFTAAALSSMTALDDKVTLEAGDTVSFRVIEDRDDAVPRVVSDTGEVDFPYIGRVKVEGKTCHEVAVEVKKLLEVDYYKQATVIVGLDLIIGQDKTKPHDMAWVVGEVHEVGPLELLKAQPITVSQAIMRAGGFGDFADQRKVKLIHRGTNASAADNAPANLNATKDFQVVDVKSVFAGKSAEDPIIRPGDYIIVPKQFVNF